MAEARIHHYDGSTCDQEGEVLLGFYFEFLDALSRPLGAMMGPYNTGKLAEEACQREFDRGPA